MEYKFNFKISIQLNSVEETRAIYQALCPEFEEIHFERSHTEVFLNGGGDVIKINIAAQDRNAGRSTINMILRWVKIGAKTVRILNDTKIGGLR